MTYFVVKDTLKVSLSLNPQKEVTLKQHFKIEENAS